MVFPRDHFKIISIELYRFEHNFKGIRKRKEIMPMAVNDGLYVSNSNLFSVRRIQTNHINIKINLGVKFR